VKALLPYVQRFTDRHGKVRHYYRRGTVRKALPDPADGHAAFLEAYHAAANNRPHTARHVAGTMASLMAEYQAARISRA